MNSSTSPEIQLWLKLGPVWHQTLIIPVEEIRRFCIHPLKWLQFVAATIHGAHGVLHQNNPLGPPAHDLQDTEDLSLSYYFVSPGKSLGSGPPVC